MARSPAARTILGESPWEPRLTVAPSHPQQGDPLILTVIIAYREGIADISPEHQRDFYEECFHYEYSSDDAELSRLLAQHASGRGVRNRGCHKRGRRYSSSRIWRPLLKKCCFTKGR